LGRQENYHEIKRNASYSRASGPGAARPGEPLSRQENDPFMTTNAAYSAIWKVVGTIPRGRVASYGQVARLAGLPKNARMVGTALGAADGLKLPWHRVMNAQGRIALPPSSRGYREQSRLLREEGVIVSKGKVDLKRFGWKADSSSPLLD
jgi:methylated-DNA-protein-cysteine methyltransferase-like protein